MGGFAEAAVEGETGVLVSHWVDKLDLKAPQRLPLHHLLLHLPCPYQSGRALQSHGSHGAGVMVAAEIGAGIEVGAEIEAGAGNEAETGIEDGVEIEAGGNAGA